MADELVGSARVRIEPDTTGFESALLSDLRSALDSATDAIASSFRDAASQASSALGDIGAGGFDPIVTAADAASSEVASTFAGVGSEIETSLLGAADAGDAALSGIGATAGDQIVSEFNGVAGDIESTIASAASAADDSLAGIGTNVPDVEITVVADTTSAEDSIAALGDTAADSGSDVSGLTDTIDDLASSTKSGEASAGGLGGTIGTLGDVASVSSGNLGGLGSAIGSLDPRLKAATAGIAVTVGVLGSFVDAGIESSETNRRLADTFGPLERSIRDVNIGSLNGDLEDLAARLGTSDELLENAASRMQTLGVQTGAAGPQVEATTEQIVALALRTRALNPALGEAGDIANKVFTALGKNGKGLASLNLSISATELSQRALNIAHERGSEVVSTYDKQIAGAQILTERYGASLKGVFGEGENNPSIRLAKLGNDFENLRQEIGEPLVVPALDALEALEPVGLAAAQAVGSVAQSLIPLLELLGQAAPAIEFTGKAIAKAFDFTPLGIAAKGINAITGKLFGPSGAEKFAAEVEEVTAALTDQNGKLVLSAAGLASYIEEQSRFDSQNQTDDLSRLGLSFEEVGKLALDGAAGAKEFDRIIRSTGDESDNNIGDLNHSFEDLQETLEGTAESALRAGIRNKELDSSFLQVAETTGSYQTALEQAEAAQDRQAQASLNAAVATGALTIADRDQLLAATASADGTADYSDALVQFRAETDAAAAAQAAFAADFAVLATALPNVASAFLLVSDGTGNLSFDMADLAVQLGGANVGATELGVIAAGLGVPLESLQGFVTNVNTAIGEFTSSVVSQLPSVGGAFTSAADAAKAAEQDLSAVDITAALSEQLVSVQRFRDDLVFLVQGGFRDIAGFGAVAGADALHALRVGIESGDKEGVVTAFRESTVPGILSVSDEIQSLLQGVVGPAYLASMGQISTEGANAFGVPLSTLPGLAGGAVAGATAQITAQGQPLVTTTGQVAVTAVTGFEDTWSTLPALTATGVAGATAAVAAGAGPFASAGAGVATSGGTAFGQTFAKATAAGGTAGVGSASLAVQAASTGAQFTAAAAGGGIGGAFARGIAAGIAANSRAVEAAARKVVRDAEIAGKNQAGISSPSKVWAEMGRNLGTSLADSLEGTSSDVVAAAESILRAAAGADSAGFGVALDQAVAGVPGASGSVGVGVDVGGVTVNVTIQTTGGVSEADARVFARQISAETVSAISAASAERQAIVDRRASV